MTITCEPWTDADSVRDCCDEITPDADLTDVIQAASGVLYQLSGRQFSGSCESTIRPCRVECGCQCHSRGRVSEVVSSGGGCFKCCPPRILLGPEPVTAVSEVLIDGAVVDPTTYRLDSGRWLTRLGDDNWPCFQDLSLASTEDNTFEITFEHGELPPPLGIQAAQELACELAKACNLSAGECRLNPRATQLTRQGVSIAIFQPDVFLTEGLTGLGGAVDLFIQTYNPSKARRRARVFSPDVPQHLRP